jgi:hypothetical protein
MQNAMGNTMQFSVFASNDLPQSYDKIRDWGHMRAFKNHEKMTADCAVSVASRRMSARHHTRSGKGVTAQNARSPSQNELRQKKWKNSEKNTRG